MIWNKYWKRVESNNSALLKENLRLKETLRQKDQIIKFYQDQQKGGLAVKECKSPRKEEKKKDFNGTNDELSYFLWDVLNKLPEGKSYRVMYKYITDSMNFLMKTESWIILKKDFAVEKYKGFICDPYRKENFKDVEVSIKEKFISSINSVSDPVIFGEKEKEVYMPFLVKYFSVTAYNCLVVPIHNEEIGNIGYVVFLNKNVEKERLDFNARDEILSAVWASVTKIFFEIEDAHFLERTIAAKILKMSQMIHEGLACTTIKDIIALFEERLPDFFGVKRVNFYLWDHKRQEIYKIVEEDYKDKLIFFSSQSGIAGKVSNEGKVMLTNNVSTYFQFSQKIDDPLGKYHSITGLPEDGVVNILTLPIYWYNEGLDDSYKHFPLAVVQVINKVNNMPFLKTEAKDLDKTSQFIGQILWRVLTKAN